MCSRLAKGSVTASGLMAESFAVLLFLPLVTQLDLLLKARAQKLVLQSCIDHHDKIFTKRSLPLTSTPLLLVNSLSSSAGMKSVGMSNSPSPKDKDKDKDKKKKPGFKRSLTGKSLAVGKGGLKLSQKKDLKDSSPSGDYAKVFSLKDHSGKKVHLAKQVAAGSRLILFFYSRDHTSKSVLKLFKSNYELFAANGCKVFGITSSKTADDVSSMRLPFPLLTDSSNRTRQKYGVSSSKNATFVLNECGEILHSYDSSDATVDHILNALYGVVLQTGGFYLRTNARIPSHHFEYFYNLTGEDTKEEEDSPQEESSGVEGWDVEEVCRWLEQNGLENFINLFEENLLTGMDLLDLDSKDLEADLGLQEDPSLPKLIAEINDVRVEHAKSKLKLK
uniref:SAM domain-containing protein n=2 Tax=Paramoeba aestuarina TaxID=180227 RepID=A0A7S4L5E4_9EUKA|mmetsp:Transcript_31644/g.49471  ORF Transcript_31644/g.49471 Transcript_31644/m.49471 type:complete len:391 (+) Transcript_31644:570-1742(+)